MAGALLHLAMGDPKKMDPDDRTFNTSYKKAYTLGLLLPDIAKQELIRSAEDFDVFFEGCAGDDILTYEEYLQFAKNNHFNPSRENPARQDTRNPNLREFMDAPYVDLKKPVWQGVLCHLMGDKAFYYKSYCIDFDRLREDYVKEVGEIKKWDEEKWQNSETARIYYDDYNLLNGHVEEQFRTWDKMSHYLQPSVIEELRTIFMIEFPDDCPEPVYMKLENIRRYVAYSRFINLEIEEGRIEEALQTFDEGILDSVFL